MKAIIIASATTLVAWIVHVGVASIYQARIGETKSLLFRSVHGLEIGFIAMVAFFILFKYLPKLELPLALITGLVTLAVVDLIFFAVFPKIWANFDMFHIAVAYFAFVCGITAAKFLS